MRTITINGKTYILKANKQLYSVQYKRNNSRDDWKVSKYTVDGRSTKRAEGLSQSLAEKYMDILEGKAAAAHPLFEVRD